MKMKKKPKVKIPKVGKKQLAEKLYKKYLKEIEALHKHNGTTYLSELQGHGKKLFGVKFKGVYPSDKIPRLNDLQPYCILNLDKSNEPGSHWVALCKTEDRNCIFYDSFGRHYTRIISNLELTGNGRIVNTELDKEQRISQTNCGQRCLAFIKVLDKWGSDVARWI